MNKLIKIVQHFFEQMGEKHVGAYASSAAFFMFLSLFPILLLICSTIPYTPITEANLVGALEQVLPDYFVPLMANVVKEVYGKTATVLSISIVAILWSAAKGILALVRGLNVINDIKETRNYFVLRLEASFYTMILLVAIVLTLSIMVFGKILVTTIVDAFPKLIYLLEFFMNIRFIFSLCILIMFFVILYSWLPSKKVRYKTQIPGAFFTSITWLVFSWGFSFYVNKYTVLSIYGSLSTLVMMMIWMYFCMYIILLGALLNRFFLPANKYLWRKRVLARRNKKDKRK